MKINCSNAVFHVTDLAASVAFYQAHLGFEVEFKFGKPPVYVGLCHGDVQLHLSSQYPYKDNRGHGNLYLIVDEVDVLYDALVAAGCEFYCELGDRDYGLRDFALKDPDDNQIGIGMMAPDATT